MSREQIEATVWRVLREHTVAVLAPRLDPTDEAARSGVLDPHTKVVQATHARLMLCVDRAIAEHLSALQRALHEGTELDHDLVDQAVESVAGWAAEEEQEG